jgi:GcrA cell cycle regulator
MIVTKPWTDEELNRLKALVNTGISASQIAKELPGRTRNAVIGCMQRRGIQNKNHPPAEHKPNSPNAKKIVRPKPVPKPKRKPPMAMPPEVPLPAVTETGENYTPLNVTLTMLRFNQCRAVVGPIDGMDTKFCGHKTDDGYSWCDFHKKLYLVPIQPRRK